MIERYCDICGRKMEDNCLRFVASVVWNGPKDIFCDTDTQNVWEDVCRTCADDIIRDISDLSTRNRMKRGDNGIEEVKDEEGDQLRKDIRQSRAGGRNNS